MALNALRSRCTALWMRVALGVWLLGLGACAAPWPLTGLVYTHVRVPLTTDLRDTPLPEQRPSSGRVVEIREPVTGFGFYAKVHSNAFGDIARADGMQTLCFADQEIFSVLGIWTSTKVHLYGE